MSNHQFCTFYAKKLEIFSQIVLTVFNVFSHFLLKNSKYFWIPITQRFWAERLFSILGYEVFSYQRGKKLCFKQNECPMTCFLLKKSKYFPKFTQRSLHHSDFRILGCDVFSHGIKKVCVFVLQIWLRSRIYELCIAY